MISVRRILCPVDFSDLSRHALAHAAVLARWYEAELVTLYATPLAPDVPPLPMRMSSVLAPFDARAMAGELQAFAGPVTEGVARVQKIVRPGAAALVILDCARELEADLLVLGTHGRTGFERLMLGSVTEKVVRKAACPVLTIPRGAEARPDRPLFPRVLCGVDFAESSARALRYALSLAEEAEGRLSLLHVVEWLPEEPLPGAHGDAQLFQESLVTEARRRLAELVPREARDWCEVETSVRCGKPYQEILRAAAVDRAELIVLGVHGHGVIDRMLFGSTTQQVVRQALCPVLTVRT
jgi:nucleotide-binding universal stress UspA family protein